MMIYIYETYENDILKLTNDNDDALFILINDVRQSLFFEWIEQKLSDNGSDYCCGMSDLLNCH